MKKLCFTIAFLTIGSAIYAQVKKPSTLTLDTTIKSGPYGSKITGVMPSDAEKEKIKELLKKRLPVNGMPNAIPQQGMPNAIKITPAPDVYVGNNGKGHDIYRSQIDNMPILKPDSTFATNIPVRTKKGYPKPVTNEPSKTPGKP